MYLSAVFQGVPGLTKCGAANGAGPVRTSVGRDWLSDGKYLSTGRIYLQDGEKLECAIIPNFPIRPSGRRASRVGVSTRKGPSGRSEDCRVSTLLSLVLLEPPLQLGQQRGILDLRWLAVAHGHSQRPIARIASQLLHNGTELKLPTRHDCVYLGNL